MTADVGTQPSVTQRIGSALISAARQLIVPALAVVSALILGAVVIILSDPKFVSLLGTDIGGAFGAGFRSVLAAYGGLLKGSVGSPDAISETFLRATPLILAGLAVALGFRAGLFNIGAEGQIYIGGMFATIVGINFDGMPTFIHLPLAVAAGFVGGALWGFIPGILKARTGAHEVITTIMLNYVSYRVIDFALHQPLLQRPDRSDPVSRFVLDSATLPPLFGDTRVHWGLVIALAAAVAVSWLLFRSTKGFEFRAVGLNPSAAGYAGMNISRCACAPPAAGKSASSIASQPVRFMEHGSFRAASLPNRRHEAASGDYRVCRLRMQGLFDQGSYISSAGGSVATPERHC